MNTIKRILECAGIAHYPKATLLIESTQIDEVFSTGTSFTVETDDDVEYSTSFESGGDRFTCSVVKAENEESMVSPFDLNIWIASFSKYDPAYGQSIAISKSEKPLEIFSNVFETIRQAISLNRIDCISFTANPAEPSRVKLYRTLATKSERLMPGWGHLDGISAGQFYIFQNKKRNLVWAHDVLYNNLITPPVRNLDVEKALVISKNAYLMVKYALSVYERIPEFEPFISRMPYSDRERGRYETISAYRRR